MSRKSHFKFRLYIAGDGPNSALAVQNLHSFCQEHLQGRHEIEMVDVLRDPERALNDGVLLTPMLLKYSPAPVRRVIGTLSVRGTLLSALDMNF